MMNLNKKIPVWLMVPLDLILVAAIILPFAYFHHIRDMWGLGAKESVQETFAPPDDGSFEKDEWFLPAGETADPADPSAAPASATVSEKAEPVVLNGGDAIRAYASSEKLPLPCPDDADLISFYRSRDVCVTLWSRTRKISGGKAQKYFVYDVRVRSYKNFYTVAGAQKGIRELISEGEAYAGGPVIAAVNGDYSSNKNHCRVVVRNGQQTRDAGEYDSDICVMYYDGSIETFEYQDFDYEAVKEKNPYQIWDFGPELLDKNGKAKSSFDSSAYDAHIIDGAHPRTAIGYYEPGHYCFVVADGRQTDDDGVTALQGLTVSELARLMENLGCKRAYNMDGGDSSQAYMNGRDIRINKDRAAQGKAQRVLSDIICIGEAE